MNVKGTDLTEIQKEQHQKEESYSLRVTNTGRNGRGDISKPDTATERPTILSMPSSVASVDEQGLS